MITPELENSRIWREQLDKQFQSLPDGVHLLSQESQDIMKRIAERSAALEAGFTKRVS